MTEKIAVELEVEDDALVESVLQVAQHKIEEIKGVTVEKKKFKEVEEEPENPHLSRIDEEANTAERLEEITGKETRRETSE